MTFSIFFKIALLGLLEPTLDQNLYYTGMKYTTATFTAAMCNILPAFAFILAWIFRIIGAIVIVIGLYLVLWGKSKDQLPPSKSDNPSCCSNSNKVATATSIEDDDDDDDDDDDADDDDDDQEMAKISDDHDHQRTQISNNQDQSVFVALDHVIIDRPHDSV
ncbi:hypothetical protein LWI28_019500 [Acer negundo]|uniref:WAT1-related protein n=1 Tax=Acer negundo TaxID=4023 RepID=A0AAD5IDE4_ACENE|nr:hypothetical protein LWI28_019500 [Acer negundo]